MFEPPFISADILLKSLANVTLFSSFESDEFCLVNDLKCGALELLGNDPGRSMKAVSPRVLCEVFKLLLRLPMLSES